MRELFHKNVRISRKEYGWYDYSTFNDFVILNLMCFKCVSKSRLHKMLSVDIAKDTLFSIRTNTYHTITLLYTCTYNVISDVFDCPDLSA